MTPANQSASRGRPGYSREDVIAAAVRAFTTRGYEATSMDQVARELGISKAALYHHISSKEEILELTVNRALRDLGAVVDDVRASDLDSGEQIRALIRGSLDVLSADPLSVTLLLRLRGNSEVETQALQRRRELTRQVAGMVVTAQKENTIRCDIDASMLTRLIFGMVNSVAEWYEPEGRLSAQEISAGVTAVLFEGLEK